MVARIALFVIYFWFGFLKIIGSSPAEPLVTALYNQTIPFIPFHFFFLGFALFECIIGLTFLFPKFTKISLVLFSLHMLTTLLPLIMLPAVIWKGMFIPSLEGQYIIKNIALIALAIQIGGARTKN